VTCKELASRWVLIKSDESFVSCIPPTRMTGTPAHSTLASTQRLDSASEPSPLQHASATGLLILLRAGSDQTIVTSPDKAAPEFLRDAVTSLPMPTEARHAPTSSYHDGMAASSAASTPLSSIDIQASPHGSEGWRVHLNSDFPMKRVGRNECLNDVSGRALRVFRKSPDPRRTRTSLP